MDYEIAVVSIQIRSEVALESCQEWTEIEQLVEINPSIIPLKIPGWLKKGETPFLDDSNPRFLGYIVYNPRTHQPCQG